MQSQFRLKVSLLIYTISIYYKDTYGFKEINKYKTIVEVFYDNELSSITKSIMEEISSIAIKLKILKKLTMNFKKMQFSLTKFNYLVFILFVLFNTQVINSQDIIKQDLNFRERQLMDYGWRFSFGHPSDATKDYDHATGYFSYLAKTGYGDGPAAKNFDDRAWRILNIPHDWAVEQPFDARGSHSHGYKAIGRNFPEASVGWYRKSFFIPEKDLGKRISIEFDGIHRNASVWVNGFYTGTVSSGYSSFAYDITEYLNYGAENIVSVRVDVTIEEGWYYEGAGIYRHVWLLKTNPLHVARNGSYITTQIEGELAKVNISLSIVNEDVKDQNFEIVFTIKDKECKTVSSLKYDNVKLKSLETQIIDKQLIINKPILWSLNSPYLYSLVTEVVANNIVIDKYETSFGVRTIYFDANKGFFLNGQHIKLQGTNNHQDHAGVGTAIPDALQEFRIKKLKEIGCNAYRCSHNPPTPELLDACDRLGMLVIDENRLMGTSSIHYQQLDEMILRDRNHPCIIAWSIGNEEWAIEGNITGARIAAAMQNHVKKLEPTRPVTVAVSGGRDNGINTVIEIMGYNYLGLGGTDEQHAKYPKQPAMGTEEGSTWATRGIYFDDKQKQYIAAYDKAPREKWYSIENGWKYYSERDYLAGMFIWTGFDYRGESTPYNWPSVTSYFGMMDLCGFYKDNCYYLKSWWQQEPVLHIFPHWNWPGMEGREIDVWAYSNCEEVELFLNNKSLGRQKVSKNSHVEWKVKYLAGTLLAKGYMAGKQIITTKIETTDQPVAINLTPDKTMLKADNDDVAVFTVSVTDKKGREVHVADNQIQFTISGPGKIIGVGNGDPTSHEPEKFIETVKTIKVENLRYNIVAKSTNYPEVTKDYNDKEWKNQLSVNQEIKLPDTSNVVIIRGSFSLPGLNESATVTFFPKSLGEVQTIYINGKLVANGLKRVEKLQGNKLDNSLLNPENNVFAVVAKPLVKKAEWENINTEAGVIQMIIPADTPKRKLFNGLAQVIVQSQHSEGEIVITATAENLKPAVFKILSQKVVVKPFVP